MISWERTVIKWPAWTTSTVFTQATREEPRWELAPPPPPFTLLRLPSRSTQEVIKGIASWGGNLRTVLRIRVGSECVKHISRRRVSDECNACIKVRVKELAATTGISVPVCFLRGFVCVLFEVSSSVSEPSSNPFWETAFNRWPKESSARSTCKEPSISACISASLLFSGWSISSPEARPIGAGSAYLLGCTDYKWDDSVSPDPTGKFDKPALHPSPFPQQVRVIDLGCSCHRHLNSAKKLVNILLWAKSRA